MSAPVARGGGTGRHVAVVTGASRGIGRAVAVRLAAEGFGVAAVGRPDGTRDTTLAGSLDETLTEVADVAGPDAAVGIGADLTDDADRARIVAEAAAAFGAEPDVLVHSAAAPREFGGGAPSIGFDEMPEARFWLAVRVNVWAFWSLAQHMIPGMRRRGAGWLLGISSRQAAPRPSPIEVAPTAMGGACAYGGTKAFLDRVATGAAQELHADNIAVNTLAPTGPVETPLSATVVSGLAPGDWEPMETMVEAAVALVTGDPRRLTSRIAYSLPLLAELGRPVSTLDGTCRFEGWQPDGTDPRAATPGYLSGH